MTTWKPPWIQLTVSWGCNGKYEQDGSRGGICTDMWDLGFSNLYFCRTWWVVLGLWGHPILEKPSMFRLDGTRPANSVEATGAGTPGGRVRAADVHGRLAAKVLGTQGGHRWRNRPLRLRWWWSPPDEGREGSWWAWPQWKLFFREDKDIRRFVILRSDAIWGFMLSPKVDQTSFGHTETAKKNIHNTSRQDTFPFKGWLP